MRIAIAADELTGVAELLGSELERRGHETLAHGAFDRRERSAWAWASEAAAREVAEGGPSRRSSAAGQAPARRSPPTRSPRSARALCLDAGAAAGARRWNDANVLALSLRSTAQAELVEILDAWFAGGPSEQAEDRDNVAHLGEIERRRAGRAAPPGEPPA